MCAALMQVLESLVCAFFDFALHGRHVPQIKVTSGQIMLSDKGLSS